jgi:phage gp29-like protein
MAQVHNTVRQDLMEADADLLDACLNETVIKWLVDYNFANVTAYPKIVTYTAAKPDLAVRSGIDKTLAKDIGCRWPNLTFTRRMESEPGLR